MDESIKLSQLRSYRIWCYFGMILIAIAVLFLILEYCGVFFNYPIFPVSLGIIFMYLTYYNAMRTDMLDSPEYWDEVFS